MNTSTTIELFGNTYSIGNLDAKRQFHVARRILPLQAALARIAPELSAAAQNTDDSAGALLMMTAVGDVLSKIPDADVDYVIDTALSVVKRKQGEAWAPVMSQGQLMFSDMTMACMVRLAFEVLREVLSSFFAPPGAAQS